MRQIGLTWTGTSDPATGSLALAARDIQAGSQVRVFLKHEISPTTVSSVTDTAGVTYTLVGQTAAGASSPGAAVYYCPIHPGGSGVVITATYSAATAQFVRGFAEEWDAGGATGVQVALVTGSGTGTAYSAPALNTTRQGVAWGGVAGFTALSNITVGGTPTGSIGATLSDCFTWRRPSGGVQTITPGASATGSAAWLMLVAVFDDFSSSRRVYTKKKRISGFNWSGSGLFDLKLSAANWYSSRLIVVPTSSGVTGTLSYTNINDSGLAAGTTTIQGTVSRTNNNDTNTASGTTTVIGFVARTNANDTLIASGSVGASVTGTVAYTNNNDTSSASGTTTLVGSLSRTNNNDTSTGQGSSLISGVLARTNNNDVGLAIGTTTLIGVLAYTNNNDTGVGSGSTGSAAAGSLAYTNNNDSVSASGFTTIVGTLNKTNNNDILSANGSSGTGPGITTRLPLTSAGTN